MRKPTVLVFVPAGDQWIHMNVVTTLVQFAIDPRFDVTIGTYSATPSEHARNTIWLKAREMAPDYLVMMDDDNPPAPGVSPLDLVGLDLDVVGCPTPMWKRESIRSVEKREGVLSLPVAWNVGKKNPPPDRGYGFAVKAGGGLHEVDVIGSGLLVIARRVFDMIDAPFMREFDEDGIVTAGSDVRFCEKARAAGFKVWAHWSYRCDHHKQVNLADVLTVMRSPIEQFKAKIEANRSQAKEVGSS